MIYQAKTEASEQGSDGESEPFVLEEMTINYGERRVTVAGCPVRLTATEYRLLQERSFVKKLRGKLGDNARSPIYIFTEPRVGYRMARP